LTLNGVTGDLRPYKVYTALLTQTGGDAPTSIYSGELIIGATYTINDNLGSGWDFTNVGAPNNDLYTSFVATGTTPNSWGIDGQLDYNEGAPVATVLENTIGNVWFTYEGIGYYKVNSNVLFINNKTIVSNIESCIINAGYTNQIYTTLPDSSTINVYTSQGASISESSDNQLQNKPIEIRVYN
jgi:hypothetical protein